MAINQVHTCQSEFDRIHFAFREMLHKKRRSVNKYFGTMEHTISPSWRVLLFLSCWHAWVTSEEPCLIYFCILKTGLAELMGVFTYLQAPGFSGRPPLCRILLPSQRAHKTLLTRIFHQLQGHLMSRWPVADFLPTAWLPNALLPYSRLPTQTSETCSTLDLCHRVSWFFFPGWMCL